MMRGINTDDIKQISRAHWPAELFFHHFIDLTEVCAVAQELAKTGEVREQHAVNEETRAVVDHNWGFAHFAGPRHDFGNGVV